MNFIDGGVIAEVAAAVAGVTQWLKNEPRLKHINGQFLAVLIGLVIGLGWFLVQGQFGSELALDKIAWHNVFKATINGVLAGISATGVYNLQKFLPIPNLLPTRSELDAEDGKDTQPAG